MRNTKPPVNIDEALGIPLQPAMLCAECLGPLDIYNCVSSSGPYFLVLRACFTRFSMTPSNASLSPICSSVLCCQ